MPGEAEKLNRSCPSQRTGLRLLVIFSLYAVQPSFAQPGDLLGGLGDMQVSGRVQVHLDNAHACYEKNDFECARKTLNLIPARELNNLEWSRYWNSLAYVEFLLGNFAEAAAAYRNLAEIPGIPDRQRSASLRSLAQLYASMGQFQQAYETLEILLVHKGEVPLAGRHLTADGLWRGLDVYVVGTWDPVPLVPAPPDYPAEAAAQGLEHGYVDLEFTVTRTGSTKDISIIESSAPLFERPAIEAAGKLRYKPKLVDGKPVEVAGVQHRIEFQPQEPD